MTEPAAPIVAILDLETTGTSPANSRIVEIAIALVDLTTGTIKRRFYELVNPNIPIPESATAIHSITDEKVRNAMHFSSIAEDITDFIGPYALGGFNVARFDLPLLQAELKRANAPALDMTERSVVDVMTIYHHHYKRDLTQALKHYCKGDHPEAHAAMADVEATAMILQAQLYAHDLPPNPAALADVGRDPNAIDRAGKFAFDDSGRPCITFGKHKGVALFNVDPSYFRWMLGADFAPDTIAIANAALSGNFPKQEPSA